jgi:hypothetical protein
MEEMAKRWHELDFGGKKAEGIMTQVPFDPTRFKPANQATNLMRALARSGKEETEKQALMSEGVRKVVWGEPEALVVEDTEGRLNGVETAEEAFSVPSCDAPSVVSSDTASIQDVEQLADENDNLDESVKDAEGRNASDLFNSEDSVSSPSSSLSAPLMLSFVEPSHSAAVGDRTESPDASECSPSTNSSRSAPKEEGKELRSRRPSPHSSA